MHSLFSKSPKHLIAGLASILLGLAILLLFAPMDQKNVAEPITKTGSPISTTPKANVLPADLLHEWVALSDYLSSRPEFSYAKQVYLHRLSAQPVRDDTRLCVFLAIAIPEDPYRVLSPSCVLIGNEQQFSFTAEQVLTLSGAPEVTLSPSADRNTLQQINDMFSLYDHGLVQLSLHII